MNTCPFVLILGDPITTTKEDKIVSVILKHSEGLLPEEMMEEEIAYITSWGVEKTFSAYWGRGAGHG